MRHWRKMLKNTGCVFTGILILVMGLLFTGHLGWVSNTVLAPLPMVLDLIAAACFAVYTASKPTGREQWGGNVVIGIMIFAVGIGLALLWFGAIHPEF